MTTIRLINDPEGIRILLHKLIRDLRRTILGAIQHHQHLDPVQRLPDHQRFQTLPDIFFHIVDRYDHRQNFVHTAIHLSSLTRTLICQPASSDSDLINS